MGHAKVKSFEEFDSEFAVFCFICKHLWSLSGAEIQILALQAGISNQTLYNWRNGYTVTPRIDTLTKVMRVLGYEITWKKTKGAPRLRRV